MTPKSAYSLREIRSSDLDLVLSWRNSPRIRSLSYNDQLIAAADHQKWFENLKNSKDRICLIFEINKNPSGVVQFFEISTDERKCKWGFYLGIEDLPRGSGSTMGELALSHLFEKFSVDTINGEALSNNEQSCRFHKKLGFVEDGIIERGVYRNGEWLDIHLFSIARQTWMRKTGRAA